MTNIIKFPKTHNAKLTYNQPELGEKTRCVVKIVWVVTVLIWPVLKWVMSIDVFFQLIRMMYHWNTPEVHAGRVFLLHFTMLTIFTYFVSLYMPKGR